MFRSDDDVAAIGSGSQYAKSAALALKKHADHLNAEEIVRESLTIAADIASIPIIFGSRDYKFKGYNKDFYGKNI